MRKRFLYLMVLLAWFVRPILPLPIFAEEELEEPVESQEVFLYNDRGARDPLWPLVSSSGIILNYDTDYLITELSLEGIIVDAHGKNVAIINGQILEEKGQIGQFVVDKISSETVTLNKHGQIFELKVTEEE